ncbi:MAG: hypothetical protein EPN82_05850 [Bacteroidetes bacterium]|nr:MAG: hypothetical protein EPN82_05850 [Bacteroidota bacterium]
MRVELMKRNRDRIKCYGTFKNTGTKSGWQGEILPTVLLTDIRDEQGNILTDHLWFNLTKQFEKLGEIPAGTKLEFEARVKEYFKGYVNRWNDIDERRNDYKLSYPTKVRIVN